ALVVDGRIAIHGLRLPEIGQEHPCRTRVSPSRFRFRPPLLLTFRLGLAAFSYGLQVRFRPTRAPCSAQAALYGGARGRASPPNRRRPQFASFSFFHSFTAFLAACGAVCGKVGTAGSGTGRRSLGL